MRLALWMATLLLVPLAWACGGGEDDDRTIDVGDGEVTAGEGLPEGWPDDFPVYDGADLQGGVRGDVDGQEGLIATWETDDDASDVVEFYTQELEDGPWRSVSTTTSGDGTIFIVQHDDDDQGGSVLIGEDEGSTTIFATIGEAFDTGDGPGDDGAGDGDGAGSDDGSGDSGSGDAPTEDDLPSEVDLPANYPSDRVPLPDGARVTQAASSTAGGIGSHVLQFYSSDSVDDVAGHFKRELEGNGFSETLRTEQDGNVLLSYSEGDDPSTGTVVIITIGDSEVPGYTSTSLQVTDPSP